jgi:hypothetical protein
MAGGSMTADTPDPRPVSPITCTCPVEWTGIYAPIRGHAPGCPDRPVSPPSELTDAEKLRVLATWFDNFDDWREATAKIDPGISEYRDVQRDLRRIAATLDAARAAPQADENPCCYSLHEFEKVCPRTGTTFYAAAPVVPAGLDVERLRQALHHAGIGCKPNILYCRATHRGHAERIAAEYDRLRADPR